MSETALAAGFPAADHSAWLALVEKTLKGADLASLDRTGAHGLTLHALYTDAPHAVTGRAAAEAVDLRAPVRGGDVLEALNGGAHSVHLLDADPADLERVLDGIALEIASVSCDAGFAGPALADALASAARGSPQARIAPWMDPLSAFASAGVSPGPIESHLVALAGAAARLAEPYPLARSIAASGIAAHEALATPAQEIAFALASAFAYTKALDRAGVPVETAWRMQTLRLAVDAQPFISIAKLRAGRSLWRRLGAACGVDSEPQIAASTSTRMLTKADAWTNLIRQTAAGFAALVGGADVILCGGFTDALGAPTPLARRMARNTLLVLTEEAHLGRVADPLAGSWAIESLTTTVVEEAWTELQRIEAAGGIIEALRSGAVATALEDSRKRLQESLGAKSTRIVGVTDFVNPASRSVEVLPAWYPPDREARLPGPDSQCPALAPQRLEDIAA